MPKDTLVTRGAADFFSSLLGCFIRLLIVTLGIGLLVGGLWLLIRLIKFMWVHS